MRDLIRNLVIQAITDNDLLTEVVDKIVEIAEENHDTDTSIHCGTCKDKKSHALNEPCVTCIDSCNHEYN